MFLYVRVNLRDSETVAFSFPSSITLITTDNITIEYTNFLPRSSLKMYQPCLMIKIINNEEIEKTKCIVQCYFVDNYYSYAMSLASTPTTIIVTYRMSIPSNFRSCFIHQTITFGVNWRRDWVYIFPLKKAKVVTVYF